MRDASRYFCTERMILIAHLVRLRLSYASTTFPNVPWPSKRETESIRYVNYASILEKSGSQTEEKVQLILTSLGEFAVLDNYKMSVIVIHPLLTRDSLLLISNVTRHGSNV